MAIPLFVTYAIRCPASGLFVYVGQTADLERRRKAHLASAKACPKRRSLDVKLWLNGLLATGRLPTFQVLELTMTRRASLNSETRWVRNLAESGHPLLNRWRSHRAIIKQCKRKGGAKAPPAKRTVRR